MRYFSHEECKINNAMRNMYRKEWSGLKHRRHGKRKSGFAGFGEVAFFSVSYTHLTLPTTPYV